MTPTQTDLDAAVCVGRRAIPGRLVLRDVPRLVMLFKVYVTISQMPPTELVLNRWTEVVISQPWPFHGEYGDGSTFACSRNHVQTARLFHSNHKSQSYFYHLTFTRFLELTMSLSLLFIVLGSANLNLWQGATDPVQFQATIGESVAPCYGLVNSLQGATDSIEMWNGAI
ncbi:hypothetical protein PIB30_016791 [Stylosanthes scabra]|uniref:Uncharacterized protein n=1 Tax=Stylosanthes scabra TaxID=79078 RepID=A0ABU6R7Q3_9FABA|nr:hypothetical protein [Stylosanthes scabra]